MSLSDTTPVRRPDMRTPGSDAEETEGAGEREKGGAVDDGVAAGPTPSGGTKTAG